MSLAPLPAAAATQKTSAPKNAVPKSVDLTLSEIPAKVFINPTGELAKGRPYQGTASSVVTASGKRLFVAWFGNGVDENLDNYIMVAFGDSTLKNFSNVRMVICSPHVGKVRCFDPAVWRDPSGRVWISWAQSTGIITFGRFFDRWSRRGSTWVIYTDNPDDENPSWSEPRRMFEGVMINKPAFLKNGEILYCVSVTRNHLVNDLHTPEEGLWIYRSRDGGLAFEKLNYIRLPENATEAMIVEKKDGTLWFLGRVDPNTLNLRYDAKTRDYIPTNVPTDGIYEAFSKDEGKTFTQAIPSKIPHPGSRFHIARLKSGNLLLLKHYANDERWLADKPKARLGEGYKPLNHNPRHRKDIIAWISPDDGKPLQGGLVLDYSTNVNYPDASQSDQGDIYISWDRARHIEAAILAAKITEADIIAKKIITPGSLTGIMVNSGRDSKNPIK